MVAKLSVKGQMVVPESIRDQAQLRQGDELDVGYANGLIVMRKREPLDAARVRKLLLNAHRLPELTPQAEASVARLIRNVRKQRKS